MQSEEAAFAVNELIQPNTVIPSHVNEAATTGGKVINGTKTSSSSIWSRVGLYMSR